MLQNLLSSATLIHNQFFPPRLIAPNLPFREGSARKSQLFKMAFPNCSHLHFCLVLLTSSFGQFLFHINNFSTNNRSCSNNSVPPQPLVNAVELTIEALHLLSFSLEHKVETDLNEIQLSLSSICSSLDFICWVPTGLARKTWAGVTLAALPHAQIHVHVCMSTHKDTHTNAHTEPL